MIRCFFICQEEPFFIPKQVDRILEEVGTRSSVVGATVLPPHRKRKNMKDWFRERSRIYNARELLMAGCAFLLSKSIGKAKRVGNGKNPYFVKDRFREHGVPLIPTTNLDDPDYLERLEQLAPDLIISISAPQLFSKKLLEIPTRYSLNLHGTLLPRHRGVFGSWWTLYHNDREAGGSIHSMEEKLDAGELLWQEAFPIDPDETQFSLAWKTKKAMAEGLVELIGKIEQGREKPLPPRYSSSYHRAPGKEEGKRFHQEGKRILRLRDLKKILRSTFEAGSKAKGGNAT